MNGARILSHPRQVKALADRLRQCPEVVRIDSGRGEEADILAQSFSELEESFRAFLDNHLVRLADSRIEPEDLCNVLLEVGEELRHILYHVRDPRFFRYLLSDDSGPPTYH